jgi:hypothetical protein
MSILARRLSHWSAPAGCPARSRVGKGYDAPSRPAERGPTVPGIDFNAVRAENIMSRGSDLVSSLLDGNVASQRVLQSLQLLANLQVACEPRFESPLQVRHAFLA